MILLPQRRLRPTIRVLIELSLNRDQFAVVLASLRARYRAGEWVEGDPLTVVDLASGYGVSATPVREALSRLAGDGLVEDRRGRGYCARRIDSVDLADLYRAQEALAHVALGAARRSGGPARPSGPILAAYRADPVQAWEELFEAVLRGANSRFLMSTQQRLADRLAPARRVEPEILGETFADFAPLAAAQSAPDLTGLECALGPFFHRRRAAAGALVERMRLNALKYKASI